MADAPASRAARLFARHPGLTVLGALMVASFAVVLLFEIGLRVFGSLNIHYYTGTRTPGVHRFPYGEVPINADGYPDEEFVKTSTKPRVGYVGDSVTFGVGAGYGYRLPDLLQQRYPQYDHWVFANVGDRLEAKRLKMQVESLKLDAVVYFMNLNDIIPDSDSAMAQTWMAGARQSWLGRVDETLRGTSYLYTYIRLGFKNAMQRLGYEVHGLPAFELTPSANAAVIQSTAARVAAALTIAAQNNAALRRCVVVLPYEMQVSTDAARVYRELGFTWEAGFEEGSTQRVLIAALQQHGVTTFDGRDAFKGVNLKVGEAFVYDKGDKVDWNHPNRRGHALLAAWLVARPDFLERCLGASAK